MPTRHAEQPVRAAEPLPARRRGPRRPVRRTPTAGKAAAARSSAASSRSRSRTSRTARWRSPTSRPASSPTIAHFARTRLLCLENTLGGKPMPLDYLEAATRLARSRGLATHLDGARLFNAAVAAGGDARAGAREIARHFDSVSVCFSKGLGAPVGSALCGSRELHRSARIAGARWPAAACARPACSPPRRCHALEHHVERLRRGPRATRGAWPTGCRARRRAASTPPQTNMVFVDLRGRGARERAASSELRSRGVLCHRPVSAALRHPSRRRCRRRCRARHREILRDTL